MPNKTVLKQSPQKDETIVGKPVANPSPLNDSGKKKKKNVSAVNAASNWRSPVDHAQPHSRSDVSGSSALANEGPYVSYEKE